MRKPRFSEVERPRGKQRQRQDLNLEVLRLRLEGWRRGVNRKVEPLGLTPLTMYAEVHDSLGLAIGIGGHAAVGTMVAGPGAHNGDDGAVGADMDVVCGLALGRVWSVRGSQVWVPSGGVPLPHAPDTSSLGVQLPGLQMAKGRVLADSWSSPEAPEGKGLSRVTQ